MIHPYLHQNLIYFLGLTARRSMSTSHRLRNGLSPSRSKQERWIKIPKLALHLQSLTKRFDHTRWRVLAFAMFIYFVVSSGN